MCECVIVYMCVCVHVSAYLTVFNIVFARCFHKIPTRQRHLLALLRTKHCVYVYARANASADVCVYVCMSSLTCRLNDWDGVGAFCTSNCYC